MKHLSRQSAYTKNIHEVELTAEEAKWPDSRIITAVDRGGHLPDDLWEDISTGKVHSGNFGGQVYKYVRQDGTATATVTVYTD